MTLLDLLVKIFFDKKSLFKNFIILIVFNFLSLLFIFYNETPTQKILVFEDVPIDANNSIYQNYEIRSMVQNGLQIKIEKDEYGFQIWDHKFITPNSGMDENTIERISNILFKAIIDNKIFIEKSVNRNPSQRNRLVNIQNYIQENKIKKFIIIDDTNNEKELQKIASIILQANIFAIILIFIFRIRLISKKL